MIDQHCHSTYSVDSTITVDEYLRFMKQKGLSYINLTDHLDILKNLKSTSIEEYHKTFSSAFEDIKSRGISTVKIGIEAGYNKSTEHLTKEFLSQYDFSIVLLSVHDNDEKSLPYFSANKSGMPIAKIMELYISQLYDAVNSSIDYDVITHLGYIFRYIREANPLDYTSSFDDVLKAIASKGKALEFNTGCIRHQTPNIISFYIEIFKRFKEFGGEHVSIGSDCHRPEDFGFGYIYAYNILTKAGFTKQTLIVDRKFEQIDLVAPVQVCDQHMHSVYSPDSTVTIEKYLEYMELFNKDYINVTEHLDLTNSPEVLSYPHYNFSNAFNSLFNDVKSDRVKFGIEVGYNSTTLKESIEILDKHDFSIVLLSIHKNDEKGFYYSRSKNSGYTADEFIDLYVDQMYRGVTSEIDYDVLAHLGFAFRYLDNSITPLDHASKFDKVLEALAKRGKALEFNTGCYYYGTEGMYEFYKEIFTKFKDYGGEYISLGSDSHSILEYTRDFDFAVTMLKSIGFEFVTQIKDRQFTQVKI